MPGFPLPSSPGTRPAPLEDPLAAAGEQEVRRQLREAVADADYPATREDLLAHVAPDQRSPVMSHLRSLPNGMVFNTPDEVAREFGGIESSGDAAG